MRSKRIEKLIALITKRGYTAPELATNLHYTLRAVRVIIQDLRQEGSVYISAYKKTSANGWSGVYKYGIGVDAEKPIPVSAKARLDKHRERETIEQKEFRLARQRQLNRKIKRDPLIAAFYGSGYSSPED